MIKHYVFIIRESNPSDRVRFSKFIEFFNSQNGSFEVWKKAGRYDTGFPCKYVNICRNYNNKLLEYFLWVIKIFLKSSRMKRDIIYVSTGFESALPIFMSAYLFQNRYVYDNADNFYQSKRFNRLFKKLIYNLEVSIISKSVFTIVPDLIRTKGFSEKLQNKFVIVKNFPSKNDYLLSSQGVKKKSCKLVIYLNGWLVETRGLRMIESFVYSLDPNLDLKIKIAGKIDNLDNIVKSKYVEYLGTINSIDSLREYHNSDLIFTFYDPKLEINKMATPNKWGDCLISNTVPIINKEIVTKTQYFPKGGYFEVEYDNHDDLKTIVMEIYNNPDLLIEKKKELKKNPTLFWESQLERLFIDLN